MSALEDKTINLMKLDFNLINDSIRRLKEGTSRLDDADEVASAHHLLIQTSAALESHVYIEENVFEAYSKNPNAAHLPENFYEKMKAEHKHLRNILIEIKRELEGTHCIAFNAVLNVFSETLSRHTELEQTVPFLEVLKHVDPSVLDDIEERVSRGFLD